MFCCSGKWKFSNDFELIQNWDFSIKNMNRGLISYIVEIRYRRGSRDNICDVLKLLFYLIFDRK